MPPTYYRGCWHVVSRGFLIKYRHSATISCSRRSSFITEVYNPKTFFLHAALLGQGFPHCRKFPTAASRRSLGRVSVPVWPVTLSGRLRIVALVGRYPADQLMRHKSILYQCFEALLIRSPCSVRTLSLIHIYVPVGIPCYDFTPIINPTLDSSFLAVRPPASGVINSREMCIRDSPCLGQVTYVLLTRSPLEHKCSRSTCMY